MQTSGKYYLALLYGAALCGAGLCGAARRCAARRGAVLLWEKHSPWSPQIADLRTPLNRGLRVSDRNGSFWTIFELPKSQFAGGLAIRRGHFGRPLAPPNRSLQAG